MSDVLGMIFDDRVSNGYKFRHATKIGNLKLL